MRVKIFKEKRNNQMIIILYCTLLFLFIKLTEQIL